MSCILGLTLVLLQAGGAQVPATETLQQRLAALLEAAVASPEQPGAVVAVVQDGALREVCARGRADLEHSTAIDAGTVFDLASCSKQFTALAILLLAQEGRLTLEDRLYDYYPDYPPYAQHVSLLHLLHHQGGVPDYMGLFAPGEDWPVQQDVVARLGGVGEARFAPGTRFEYSNSGYLLLASIVEEASGQRFPRFLQSRVFEPLAMSRTRVYDESRPSIEGRAHCYTRDLGRWRCIDEHPLNLVYGDGSVNSCIEDLARWVTALLDATLLEPSFQQLMFRPASLPDGSDPGFGCGFRVGDVDGNPVVLHGGAWLGFRSGIVLCASRRLAIIVLANFAECDGDELARDALRCALQE